MSHSVYQSNGKPLSQQALYQQKLRQGIYNSPNGASIGVNTNASDTAALLAASTDLTVRPSYERTIAPEAHTAALAAKKENISAWSRDSTDPLAESAAGNARSSTLTSQYTTSSVSSYVGTGIPSLKGDSIYRVANENSTSTMTSRINPEKDVKRIGLVSKKTSSGTLDLHKINQVANKNSTKSLNSRFNPDLDYRSGLKANAIAPAEYLNQEEEILAANGAAASLKHGSGLSDRLSSQPRSQSFKAVDVVNSTLLAAANHNANSRLQSLSSVEPKDFKAQAQLYAGALAIAQKNSEARLAQNKAGLIDLGGGLTITQAELNKMASSVVQPVLNDISEKALAQRKIDADKLKKQRELQQSHQEAKKEEYAAKLQEKAEIEQAKQQRVSENEDKKKVENDKYEEYQKEKNDAIQVQVTELKALEQKYAEEKEALLAEKQENQDRIDEEEAKLIADRKQELDDLQAEKDEIVKPVLDELSTETSKLKELTDAKEELLNEVKASETTNEEYEAKLAELNEQLATTQADIEKYTVDLEGATKKHEETSKEVDELNQYTIDELNKAEIANKDLDEKIAELEKTKADHLAEKQAKREEILSEIDQKVKDEHNINSELPEHLRKDVDESKLRDTGSLFSFDEPKEVPLVSEPKVEEETPSAAPAVAATSGLKTAVVQPVAVAASKASTTKKPSGFKRLSSIFRSPIKSSSKPPSKNISAPIAKKEEPVSATSAGVEETKSSAADIIGSGNGTSEADFDGVDDSSLNDIGKPKQKGSVFKEEED
ncbi:uncharacterized protein RJT21DRAFT_111849 [Scheffersomyces amazonensis]|uniref:uncharacterized protein n=1 Tax=Scheffersomyces amazonensis TaxID=1078765 RepID=UPI00315DF11D